MRKQISPFIKFQTITSSKEHKVSCNKIVGWLQIIARLNTVHPNERHKVATTSPSTKVDTSLYN